MAVQNINILKSWFEADDTPTQEQFWSLLDSFRHQLTKITANDLDNELLNAINSGVGASQPLTIVLPANTTQWAIPNGTLIEKILIEDDADLVVSVGSTNGGDEFISDFEIIGGYGIYVKDIYGKNDTTIYFTGTTANSIIKLYIRI